MGAVFRRIMQALFLAGVTVSASASASPSLSASYLIHPDDPVLGNPHGTVTIVDFYDTSCMPCRAMVRRINRLIAKDPRIRYVPIDMPILGSQSVLGAQALIAASMQGKFLAMQTRLLHQTRLPSVGLLRADATQLGLNVPLFIRDLTSRATVAAVSKTLHRGAKLGIHYVPVIYINQTRIPGAISYRDLRWLVRHPDQKFVVDPPPGPANS
ncbi:thioredoxin domain-containing protein [Acidiphilium acidophilum]|uniref:DsbA family protein n=1 Tax=Acidiphilium acidophilum TaxID=76588 RepID=UPI002E8E63B0|nr:thioredoxin domain-containing protein [Acidiphilium acidophilum]